MWRAAWKGLIGHRLRFALTALSIALGVGLVAASYMFTDSLGRAFEDLFSASLSGFDVQVRGEVDEELSFVQGAPLPQSLIDEVAQVPGVTAATGTVFGFVQASVGEEPLGNGSAPTFVVSWPELVDLFEIQSGERPDAPGEAALDPSTSQRQGIDLGDEIVAIGVSTRETFEIVGTAAIEGFESFGGAVSIYVPLETAQALLDLPEQVLTIEVESTGEVEAMIARIERILPEGVEAVSAQSAAEEQLASFKEALGFLNTFLLVFAGVTVFVAAFLIQNTFRIIVAQRTQELATLRLVGASRRQVLRQVMIEAAVVGGAASVLGIGFGVLLARLIRQLLSLGGSLPATPLALQPRTVLVALATGLGITLLSALLPARAASRIPPIAALRRVQAPESSQTQRRRAVVGLALTGLGAVLLTIGLIGSDLPVPDVTVVGIGAGSTFIGVAIVLSAIARPITAFIGAPIRRLGVPGRLAVDNAGRIPRRTAATASALMVGLALVGLTLVLADSLKATADRLIGDRFEADLVVSPAGFGASRLSPQLAVDLASLNEIEVLAAVRDGQVQFEGETRNAIGGPTDVLAELVNFNVLAGRIEDISGNRVGLREGLGEGREIGDEITIEFARTGEQTFELAAVFEASGLVGGILIDDVAFAANFTEQLDSQIFVGLAGGLDLAAGKTAVESIVATYTGAQVLDQSELADEASSQIDGLVRLVFGLLGVAVVIAVIGITNTLSLSVLERTREIGLLRAVGMNRRQLRRAISLESILIASLGGLLGMGLGLTFAWAVIEAIDAEFLRLSIPWGQVGLALAGAAVAGLLAALIPAWRASRRNILTAIAYE
ncbi:MAG: ABC transporter permease [Acidimicrobiia bacterium]|nr:FtsX-like permease family protein [Acidimicrobiia bacterium]